MERIEIVENGLFLVFEIADGKCFKFLHFGKKPFNEKDIIARSTSYASQVPLQYICFHGAHRDDHNQTD